MKKQYMLTLVGEDVAGIVAAVTSDLSDANCNLGETSMMRLGGSFSILMIVGTEHSSSDIKSILDKTCQRFNLKLHVDPLNTNASPKQIVPDVRIGIYGADSTGIVAKVTRVLADSGLNITNLSSDIAGGGDGSAIYVLSVSGQAEQGYDVLENAVKKLQADKLEVSIEPIQLLLG